MTDLPIEHATENLKLEARAYVDLFQVWLKTGARLYLKANNNVTWQGHEYEGMGLKITGVGTSSDSAATRPQFTVVNPKGIFSPLIRDGELNRAGVHRYRVLRPHVDADMAVYQLQSWIVMRIQLVTKANIVMELRDMTDGPSFTTPARMYIPPDFPLVSLR